jgi:hypothetical protein
MKITYYHIRKEDGEHIAPRGGVTLAMEQIEAWYFDTLEMGTFFEKSIGKARCSRDDNYCKKVGRDLAVERMKPTKLTVIASIVSPVDNKKIVVLKDAKDNSLYYLKKVTGNNRVYLDEYLETK